MTMTSLRFKALLVLLLASNLAAAGNKTIDGGAGKNALEINIGIDLDSFSSITYDGSKVYTFNVSDSLILAKNFDSLSVNSIAWTNLVGNGSPRSAVQ